MREVLFRGKEQHTNRWVRGDFSSPNSIKPINKNELEALVEPESVGQSTGVLDSCGELIFEGDIVCAQDGSLYEIRWHDAGFSLFRKGLIEQMSEEEKVRILKKSKIVGNRCDNSALTLAGKMRKCMSLKIITAINYAREIRMCVEVDGKSVSSLDEMTDFFYQQIAMGRKYLPIGECDNFDYEKGCRGHLEEVNE